ncbi:class I SAM-dependent methyltransferase [Blastococcus tunisiensis]|uniref:Methyltransferase domain-containing protein n=1 Tax=Blastococcus tunisiensis TaxID=1798228 RepID=A0A1I2I0P6_9ACTN|nr:class I SAM-dependent methyltransferase [Blastococcus sp. DSM 46838]SFF35193.1 Methyltransferase domain-containing protein [Blastococcus sp. DSM 46838]
MNAIEDTRRTEVTGQERAYLPPMGKEWLLPLYDPFTRLFGVRGVHRQLLDQAALRPGQRVLEIGCGTGTLLLLAKEGQPGVAAVGLDPDLSALARARRKARRRQVELQLDRGYADALPYADGSVDVVLSSFMLHHLPAGQREQAAREVHRVLRPGGLLHVVDMGGHAHAHEGGIARRAQQDERLQANVGDGIPRLLREAGFADVAEVASVVHRRIVRLTFVRATA